MNKVTLINFTIFDRLRNFKDIGLAKCIWAACFILLCTGESFAQDNTEQAASSESLKKQIADTQKARANQQYAENYAFNDPTQRKVFLELTEELRCPKCQNQNIADSDAPIAHDMRRKVYELMQQGSDKPDVIAWMKKRYGDFVYYQPPVNPLTLWLWVLPIAFVVIMLFFFVRRRKTIDDSNVDEKLARAEALLKDN